MKQPSALAVVMILGLAGCANEDTIEGTLEGPAAHVRIDDFKLCVGRQYLFPHWQSLAQMSEVFVKGGKLNNTSSIASDGAIVPNPYSHRISLLLFTEHANGLRPEVLKEIRSKKYDWQRHPHDRINVELLTSVTAAKLSQPLSNHLTAYLPSGDMDLGFHSRRRNPDCVGQNVQWGLLSAVTLGPECKESELKFGHAIDPRIILHCSPEMCSSVVPIEHRSVFLTYWFSRSMLQHWPTLHTNVLKRVSEWRDEQGCGVKKWP